MEANLKYVSICRVGIEDIDLFVKYRIDYLAEMQGDASAECRQKLEEELNNHFKAEMEQERFFAFVAKKEGEVLGFGAMIVRKIPGDFNKPVYLEGDILNMYTLPSARRKGVSTMILKKLIKEASNRGISKISLHTTKEGEKLYRNFGFSETLYPVLELPLLSN